MKYAAARSEMFTVANNAIVANSALLPSALEMRWPGVAKPGVDRPTTGFYAAIALHTIRDGQASLTSILGNRRFAAYVQLQMQIFAPISLAGSDEHSRVFAEAIRDAFCNPSPSGVLSFFNQIVREVGNNDTHYITNIVVDCTYDDFK